MACCLLLGFYFVFLSARCLFLGFTGPLELGSQPNTRTHKYPGLLQKQQNVKWRTGGLNTHQYGWAMGGGQLEIPYWEPGEWSEESVWLELERPEFKSSLSHEVHMVTLGSANSSQTNWTHKEEKITLSTLEKEQNNNLDSINTFFLQVNHEDAKHSKAKALVSPSWLQANLGTGSDETPIFFLAWHISCHIQQWQYDSLQYWIFPLSCWVSNLLLCSIQETPFK